MKNRAEVLEVKQTDVEIESISAIVFGRRLTTNASGTLLFNC
jgi:hypothetical protein